MGCKSNTVDLDMHILLCTRLTLSYVPAFVFYSPLLKYKVKNYELHLQIYQIFHGSFYHTFFN